MRSGIRKDPTPRPTGSVIIEWVHLRDGVLARAGLLHLRDPIRLHTTLQATDGINNLGLRVHRCVERALPGWGRWTATLATIAYRSTHRQAHSMAGDALLLTLAWVLHPRRGRHARAKAAMAVVQSLDPSFESYGRLLILTGYMDADGNVRKATAC